MVSTPAQCLADGLHIANHSCRPYLSGTLNIPKPLQPIVIEVLSPSTNYYVMPTPLFLLGFTLLLLSLFISHKLSKVPIEQLGHVGIRGRRYFSWNESISGDCGNKLIDWWLFGGSVWLRSWYCIHDIMFGQYGVEDDEDGKSVDKAAEGENLFACFGVANNDVSTKDSAKVNHDEKSDKIDEQAKRCNSASIGIIGYDSSLGAHGPLIMSLLRASMMLLVWCSVSSFLVRTHAELVGWMVDMNGVSPSSPPRNEQLIAFALHAVHWIQSIMEIGEDILGENTHPIIYAAGFVAFVEISLYVFGKVCTTLHIYVPRGVSHPGGARPHKIARLPKWTEGKEHFLPKELLRFRCAVAHDSHRDSESKVSMTSDKPKLTGEPFGRQIWTTLKPQASKGGVETEDDLEAILKKEFSSSSQNGAASDRKEEPNILQRILSPEKSPDKKDQKPDMIGDFVHNILSTKDNILLKEGKQDVIGEFVHNMFSPNKKKDDNQEGNDERNKLVQTLASGGRKPMAFVPSKNPNTSDQIFRGQMINSYLEKNDGKLPEDISFVQSVNEEETSSNPPQTVKEAAKRGIAFYSMLQTTDGHFAGDYGGPHFLLPGLVVAWYVMGCPQMLISPPQQALMLYYLKVHQQEDGGWGTHIESPSTMFGSVMSYLAARLLGASADLDWIEKGREFIQAEGGAIMTSSWAKFWLCLVGCMDWKGFNSVPPEMWLLPNWFPFHPGRLWCHCRMVYLPMGYLYGSRFIYSDAEKDPLIADLRKELYCQPYDSIHWDSTRHLVADMDNYSPVPLFMKFANNCLSIYENWSIFNPFRNAVRKAGLRFCSEYMAAEDLQTNYIDIGPVNKALNMVSAFHAAKSDINDQAVCKHMMRAPDYLWVAEDGMKMQGYNGSQCWDTSFAIQAVWECGMLDDFPILSSKIWAYLERTQILSTETSQSSPAYQYESCESRDKFYRHVSKGGWPFSTSAHGWPISDCTGEGLKGVLALMDSPLVMNAVKKGIIKGIQPSRLYDAVNVILTLQNEDGGWATYENNRGFGWYEQLNPSEVFGDIMIDYSYVECSMASMTALADFHEKFPYHRTKEITFALRRGAQFMKSIQREDGSWYGSWACCFCYGCWFGIEGLIKAGESNNSPAIQKCCQFLLSHQRPNGGWGEDFTSCYDKDYAENGMQSYGDDGSGVVNTAWALMALSAAKCNDVNAIRRGVQYLMKRQLECGDWPQEGISGVFNRACGITYTAYRNVFPIWALGRCAATYGSVLDNVQREDNRNRRGE